MACEAEYSFAPKFVALTASDPFVYCALLSGVAGDNSYYIDIYNTTQSCATTEQAIVDNLPNLLANYNAQLPEGVVIDLNSMQFVGATVTGSPYEIRAAIQYDDSGGQNKDGGYWSADVDASGNISNLVNHTLFGASVQMTLGGVNYMTIRNGDIGFVGPTEARITISQAAYTADATALLACLVPACGAPAPSPLPTVGGAVKSANYTKLFNPLGLSLKDI